MEKVLDVYKRPYDPKFPVICMDGMAEIELNVLIRQCLNRRIPDIASVAAEVQAWQAHRNTQNAMINWQFTTKDARIKLRRLYPTLHV